MAAVMSAGTLNRNRQRLMGPAEPRALRMQYICFLEKDGPIREVWLLECARPVEGRECGHRYIIYRSQFRQRKCPNCQAGRPGIKIYGS